MQKWETPELRELVRALLSLKTERDLLNFLRDVATLEELEELSSRWQVALLLEQENPYRDIAKKTGVSTATITRIAQWLHHGEGGYQQALKYIQKKSSSRRTRKSAVSKK